MMMMCSIVRLYKTIVEGGELNEVARLQAGVGV